MSIGKIIKRMGLQMRKARQLKRDRQKDLAARMGVSRLTVIKMEKGERVWNDEFLIIIADLGWEIFSKFDKLNKKEFNFLLKIIIVLESGYKLSPYNFDIALRLITYYSFIGNFERMLEIYKTLDIKGI